MQFREAPLRSFLRGPKWRMEQSFDTCRPKQEVFPDCSDKAEVNSYN